MTTPIGERSRRAPPRPCSAGPRRDELRPLVAQTLVASGRFRVSAGPPDQVELFQEVARRVSEMLQRPVISYTNGREIVITFGQQEPAALALRSCSAADCVVGMW
jgi:hypothetical protein